MCIVDPCLVLVLRWRKEHLAEKDWLLALVRQEHSLPAEFPRPALSRLRNAAGTARRLYVKSLTEPNIWVWEWSGLLANHLVVVSVSGGCQREWGFSRER